MLFLLFTLVPLLGSLPLAFQQTFGARESRWVGWDNFVYLIRDPLFWVAARNTALFTLGSVGLQMPLSLGLAMLLNRPGLRGKPLWRLIFFAPSLVGTVFVAMMFALLFQRRTGLANVSLHRLFNFPLNFPWLERYTLPALVLCSLWTLVGYNMVYFLAALQNVDRDTLEAAEIDGATAWGRFWHVTLPAIAPVSGFVALLAVIGSLQLFELPFVLLGGAGVRNRGLTLVMYLYNTGFNVGDLGYASAIGWVLTLLLGSAAMFQRRVYANSEA